MGIRYYLPNERIRAAATLERDKKGYPYG